MIELLETVSLSELFIILVLFALALKELISLGDFFWGKVKSIFNREQKEDNQIKSIEEKMDRLEKILAEHEKVSIEIRNQNKEEVNKILEQLESQQKILNLLVESDKDDIKGWIVQQYHFFTAKGNIDDFSRDTIEKRASHYFEEGGNSYIEDILAQIRQLPPE